MKKTILISSLAIACVIALASPSAYASGSGEKPVSSNAKAMKTFMQNFPQANDVTWSVVEKEPVASFMMADRKVRCFFSRTGSLASTIIECSAQHLPFEIQVNLNKHFPGYIPQSLTEYISGNEHAYYVLLKVEQEGFIKWVRVKTDENGRNILIIQKLQQTL